MDNDECNPTHQGKRITAPSKDEIEYRRRILSRVIDRRRDTRIAELKTNEKERRKANQFRERWREGVKVKRNKDVITDVEKRILKNTIQNNPELLLDLKLGAKLENGVSFEFACRELIVGLGSPEVGLDSGHLLNTFDEKKIDYTEIASVSEGETNFDGTNENVKITTPQAVSFLRRSLTFNLAIHDRLQALNASKDPKIDFDKASTRKSLPRTLSANFTGNLTTGGALNSVPAVNSLGDGCLFTSYEAQAQMTEQMNNLISTFYRSNSSGGVPGTGRRVKTTGLLAKILKSSAESRNQQAQWRDPQSHAQEMLLSPLQRAARKRLESGASSTAGESLYISPSQTPGVLQAQSSAELPGFGTAEGEGGENSFFCSLTEGMFLVGPNKPDIAEIIKSKHQEEGRKGAFTSRSNLMDPAGVRMDFQVHLVPKILFRIENNYPQDLLEQLPFYCFPSGAEVNISSSNISADNTPRGMSPLNVSEKISAAPGQGKKAGRTGSSKASGGTSTFAQAQLGIESLTGAKFIKKGVRAFFPSDQAIPSYGVSAKSTASASGVPVSPMNYGIKYNKPVLASRSPFVILMGDHTNMQYCLCLQLPVSFEDTVYGVMVHTSYVLCLMTKLPLFNYLFHVLDRFDSLFHALNFSQLVPVQDLNIPFLPELRMLNDLANRLRKILVPLYPYVVNNSEDKEEVNPVQGIDVSLLDLPTNITSILPDIELIMSGRKVQKQEITLRRSVFQHFFSSTGIKYDSQNKDMRCIIDSYNKMAPSFKANLNHRSEKDKEETFLVLLWALPVLLKYLPLDQIVLALGCALSEMHIIVEHKDFHVISSIILALMHLLKPLKWISPVIVILPDSWIDMIEAPMPIIIGLQKLPENFLLLERFVVINPQERIVHLNPTDVVGLHTILLPNASKLVQALRGPAETILKLTKRKKHPKVRRSSGVPIHSTQGEETGRDTAADPETASSSAALAGGAGGRIRTSGRFVRVNSTWIKTKIVGDKGFLDANHSNDVPDPGLNSVGALSDPLPVELDFDSYENLQLLSAVQSFSTLVSNHIQAILNTAIQMQQQERQASRSRRRLLITTLKNTHQNAISSTKVSPPVAPSKKSPETVPSPTPGASGANITEHGEAGLAKTDEEVRSNSSERRTNSGAESNISDTDLPSRRPTVATGVSKGSKHFSISSGSSAGAASAKTPTRPPMVPMESTTSSSQKSRASIDNSALFDGSSPKKSKKKTVKQKEKKPSSAEKKSVSAAEDSDNNTLDSSPKRDLRHSVSRQSVCSDRDAASYQLSAEIVGLVSTKGFSDDGSYRGGAKGKARFKSVEEATEKEEEEKDEEEEEEENIAPEIFEEEMNTRPEISPTNSRASAVARTPRRVGRNSLKEPREWKPVLASRNNQSKIIAHEKKPTGSAEKVEEKTSGTLTSSFDLPLNSTAAKFLTDDAYSEYSGNSAAKPGPSLRGGALVKPKPTKAAKERRVSTSDASLPGLPPKRAPLRRLSEPKAPLAPPAKKSLSSIFTEEKPSQPQPLEPSRKKSPPPSPHKTEGSGVFSASINTSVPERVRVPSFPTQQQMSQSAKGYFPLDSHQNSKSSYDDSYSDITYTDGGLGGMLDGDPHNESLEERGGFNLNSGSSTTSSSLPSLKQNAPLLVVREIGQGGIKFVKNLLETQMFSYYCQNLKEVSTQIKQATARAQAQNLDINQSTSSLITEKNLKQAMGKYSGFQGITTPPNISKSFFRGYRGLPAAMEDEEEDEEEEVDSIVSVFQIILSGTIPIGVEQLRSLVQKYKDSYRKELDVAALLKEYEYELNLLKRKTVDDLTRIATADLARPKLRQSEEKPAVKIGDIEMSEQTKGDSLDVLWCNGLLCNGNCNTPYCTEICINLWQSKVQRLRHQAVFKEIVKKHHHSALVMQEHVIKLPAGKMGILKGALSSTCVHGKDRFVKINLRQKAEMVQHKSETKSQFELRKSIVEKSSKGIEVLDGNRKSPKQESKRLSKIREERRKEILGPREKSMGKATKRGKKAVYASGKADPATYAIAEYYAAKQERMVRRKIKRAMAVLRPFLHKFIRLFRDAKLLYAVHFIQACIRGFLVRNNIPKLVESLILRKIQRLLACIRIRTYIRLHAEDISRRLLRMKQRRRLPIPIGVSSSAGGAGREMKSKFSVEFSGSSYRSSFGIAADGIADISDYSTGKMRPVRSSLSNVASPGAPEKVPSPLQPIVNEVDTPQPSPTKEVKSLSVSASDVAEASSRISNTSDASATQQIVKHPFESSSEQFRPNRSVKKLGPAAIEKAREFLQFGKLIRRSVSNDFKRRQTRRASAPFQLRTVNSDLQASSQRPVTAEPAGLAQRRSSLHERKPKNLMIEIQTSSKSNTNSDETQSENIRPFGKSASTSIDVEGNDNLESFSGMIAPEIGAELEETEEADELISRHSHESLVPTMSFIYDDSSDEELKRSNRLHARIRKNRLNRVSHDFSSELMELQSSSKEDRTPEKMGLSADMGSSLAYSNARSESLIGSPFSDGMGVSEDTRNASTKPSSGKLTRNFSDPSILSSSSKTSFVSGKSSEDRLSPHNSPGRKKTPVGLIGEADLMSVNSRNSKTSGISRASRISGSSHLSRDSKNTAQRSTTDSPSRNGHRRHHKHHKHHRHHRQSHHSSKAAPPLPTHSPLTGVSGTMLGSSSSSFTPPGATNVVKRSPIGRYVQEQQYDMTALVTPRGQQQLNSFASPTITPTSMSVVSASLFSQRSDKTETTEGSKKRFSAGSASHEVKPFQHFSSDSRLMSGDEDFAELKRQLSHHQSLKKETPKKGETAATLLWSSVDEAPAKLQTVEEEDQRESVAAVPERISYQKDAEDPGAAQAVSEEKEEPEEDEEEEEEEEGSVPQADDLREALKTYPLKTLGSPAMNLGRQQLYKILEMWNLLRNGVTVLKHGRAGRPKYKTLFCDLHMTKLYWRSPGSRPDEEDLSEDEQPRGLGRIEEEQKGSPEAHPHAQRRRRTLGGLIPMPKLTKKTLFAAGRKSAESELGPKNNRRQSIAKKSDEDRVIMLREILEVRDDYGTDVMQRSLAKNFAVPNCAGMLAVSIILAGRSLDFELEEELWGSIFHALLIIMNYYQVILPGQRASVGSFCSSLSPVEEEMAPILRYDYNFLSFHRSSHSK